MRILRNIGLGIICAHACVTSLAVAQAVPTRPRINVQAANPLILGDDISIRLEGLAVGAEYQLALDVVNEWGVAYQSVNTFAAGASGIIDLNKDAPLRGTYAGADRLGIFWSATRTGASPPVGPLDAPSDSINFTLKLRRSGQVIDSLKRVQWLLRPGTKVSEVREHGVVGALYEPEGTGRRPLIVLLGGSGGGMTWQRQTAAVLASKGYTAFAVAYFGATGLPQALAEIPLEYFREAIALGRRSARVDTTHVGVIGLSRGAEAALLVASNFAEISMVIAFAPSHVVWMGQRPPDFQDVASWTLGGKPIAYVPTMEVRAFRSTDNEAERHLRYLASNVDAIAPAQIPVERIRGPVLMFSGGSDPIWPTALMAERISERLTTKGFSYPVRRFSYDSAGHAFARPGFMSTAPAGFSGGSPRANAYAQTDSWTKTLDFLAEWARTRR